MKQVEIRWCFPFIWKIVLHKKLVDIERMDRKALITNVHKDPEYVRNKFDFIALTYDRFTRLASFGQDTVWKQKLLSHIGIVKPSNPIRVLDLASGTGDLTFEIAKRAPEGSRVTGVDISAGMTSRASELRLQFPSEVQNKVDFACQSVMDLKEPKDSVDYVTVSYGFRNFPNCDSS